MLLLMLICVVLIALILLVNYFFSLHMMISNHTFCLPKIFNDTLILGVSHFLCFEYHCSNLDTMILMFHLIRNTSIATQIKLKLIRICVLFQFLNSFIEFNIRDKMENYYLKWQCMQTFMHFGTIVVPTSVLSDKQWHVRLVVRRHTLLIILKHLSRIDWWQIKYVHTMKVTKWHKNICNIVNRFW